MTYKALFLDIDGTILGADQTIATSTKDALNQVQQQGVEVFLATGRPLHEIADLAAELDVHSLIGYNGAFATYRDKTIINEPMTGSTIEQFLGIAKANNHEMVLYTRDKNYFTALHKPVVQKFITTFHLRQNEVFTRAAIEQVLGLTLINVGDSDLSPYKIESSLHFAPVILPGAEQSCDVIRKSVNKGNAVEKVLELMNIPQEAAIAFGDGMNDKEMLRSVGEGVAMGNAHPDLFAYAKHRTSAVDDAGVFNGLKMLGLVE